MEKLFWIVFDVLAPLFAIIILGYLCKVAGLVKEQEQPQMSAIGFQIFMPIMVFYYIYVYRDGKAYSGLLMLFCAVGILLTCFGAVVYANFFEKDFNRRGTVAQGIFRSNYTLLGLPIISSVYPQATGIAALVGIVVVSLFNGISVVVLEAFRGKQIGLKFLVKDIVKNPLVIASILGVALVLLDIRFPAVIENATEQLADIATPYLLFLLGGSFRFRIQIDKALVSCLVGRLLVVPAIVLGIAAVCGFRNEEFAILLAVFASPAAVSSFPMAQQLGGDAELAGNTIVVGSLMSFFTILFWSVLFMYLHVF